MLERFDLNNASCVHRSDQAGGRFGRCSGTFLDALAFLESVTEKVQPKQLLVGEQCEH